MQKQTNHPQHINCKVKSCRHNCGQDDCDLMSILVAPKDNCGSGNPDESLCSSYQTGAK